MTNKIIYLTVDDSPSQSFGNKVAFLRERNIPCMFFCRGDLIKSQMENICHAIHSGYHIGNHGYRHIHFSLLSLNSCLNEIMRTDELIGQAYQRCGVTNYHKVFRFPYGDKGDFKFGYHLFPFEVAYKKGQSSRHSLSAVLNILQAKNSGHFLNRIKRNGEIRKALIQDYLKNSGYMKPQLVDVNYQFYEQLKSDYDWTWTFDLGEWKYTDMDKSAIRKIQNIIDHPHPMIYFGEIKETHGLHCRSSADVVLLHDHCKTDDLFYKAIDHMVQKKIHFKDPLTGLEKATLSEHF